MTRARILALTSIVILVAMLATSCRLPPSPPAQEPPPEGQGSTPGGKEPPQKGGGAPLVECNEPENPDKPAVTERYWVAEQVVVTGARSDIEEFVEPGLPGSDGNIRLSRLADCTYNYLTGNDAESVIQELAPGLGYAPEPAKFDELVTRLYRIESGGTITDVVRAVQAVAVEGRLVHAEPNFLVGLSGSSGCANPYTVEGSPFTVEGSPFTVEGSNKGGPGGAASAADFDAQWAWKMIGITMKGRAGYGSGVRVGIFDTSPFAQQVAVAAAQPITIGHARPIPMTLTVHHPPLSVALQPGPGADPAPLSVQHGLFVAGLIHAVAPSAELHLYRLLNEAGCADLYDLQKELHKFVAEFSGEDATLEKTVINLSLGVHRPAHLYELFEEIWSLMIPTRVAETRGAVIVAAAGNDSGPLAARGATGQLVETERPASYGWVIGVAAVNLDGKRACYSNPGDLAAPGGDGGPQPGKSNPCLPKAHDCTGPDCPYGVISLVDRPAEEGGPFAYWAGTSFAAPIVSGLFAAELGVPTSPTPSQLKIKVEQTACPPDPSQLPEDKQALGKGIVNESGQCGPP